MRQRAAPEAFKTVQCVIHAPDAPAKRERKHSHYLENRFEHRPSEYRNFCALGYRRQRRRGKEAVMQFLENFCRQRR